MRTLILITVVALLDAPSLASQEFPASTPFQARRDRVFARLGDDLLIVTSVARLREGGMRQAPDFQYLTGLNNVLGGVLVLDGRAREARLFLPPRLPGLAGWIASMDPRRSDTTGVGASRLNEVTEWSRFAEYLDRRLATDSTPVLHVDVYDGAEPSVGTPLDTLPSDLRREWQRTLATRFPRAAIRPGARIISELRAVKDGLEIEVLRRVGATSAAAFLDGLGAVVPGARQRVIEGAVIAGCMRAGADGPSFWPWAMSGPNAPYPQPWRGLADHRHLDRVARTGELLRLDVGCEIEHYMGDVGRTLPVSGRFDPSQRETWNLIVAAYRVGLAQIRPGVRSADVIAASFREVERRRATLRTPLAREVAATILRGDARAWQLHGVGLADAEALPDTLRAGMVFAYEPIVSFAGQGFYLEDMVLVTASGHEVLTPGLPYTAGDIEAAMRAAQVSSRRRR